MGRKARPIFLNEAQHDEKVFLGNPLGVGDLCLRHRHRLCSLRARFVRLLPVCLVLPGHSGYVDARGFFAGVFHFDIGLLHRREVRVLGVFRIGTNQLGCPLETRHHLTWTFLFKSFADSEFPRGVVFPSPGRFLSRFFPAFLRPASFFFEGLLMDRIELARRLGIKAAINDKNFKSLIGRLKSAQERSIFVKAFYFAKKEKEAELEERKK